MRKAVLAGALIALMSGLYFAAIAQAAKPAKEAPRIAKEEVKKLMGKADVVILDARTGASWSGSDKMIKDAIRVEPDNVDSWAGKFSKTKKIIVYCS